MKSFIFLVRKGENMSNIKKISHEKLEINEILDQLYKEAILPKTKALIEKLMPSTDILKIEEQLQNVDEALKIVLRFERAPILISSDYDMILERSAKGATLSGEEIYETEKLFLTIKANLLLLKSLKNEKIACKNYEEIILRLEVIDYLDKLIISSISEDGAILDNASPALFKIRKQLSQIDLKIKEKCLEILSKESSRLASNTIVMRNDCYCLPVKIEYKNAIKGSIQDYSSSMQTVFIEPDAVASLVREKNLLFHKEHEEVERILKELSSSIFNEIVCLKSNLDLIVDLDLLFAKAILATHYDGRKPRINNIGNLELVNARHPLLKVKKVIPNNVAFTSDYDGIIITGPNTGGKTVMLKTVGLLVLMTKYGLLIPAAESSNIMLYDEVYCDIGDDQSIANNLSTFSSHMKNIVEIIDNVTSDSLVLFDEIGAGTDPIEGSNLAKAILKYLIANHVSFITTTHYSDLKAFAFDAPRIINASMEFDQTTLSPTYHLLIGVTGSSNALNIATKLGLKPEIISEANTLMIENETDTRKLITKLEKMVHENEILKEKLASELSIARKKEEKFNELLSNIEAERIKIIEKATSEAKKIVEKAKNDGNYIISSLQEKINQNLKLHEVIALKKTLDDLDVTPAKQKPKVKKSTSEQINVGDDVYIEAYDQYGEVVSINKNGTFHISIGNIKLDLTKDEISKVKKKKEIKITPVKVTTSISKANISVVLDLRGKRYEEAIDSMDKYIDDLVVAGIKQASIIHGYGTGAIRNAVQQFVRRCPHIKSYRYGNELEGGFGVTVIELK